VREELRVAPPVALERRAAGVERVAVDLDHEVVLRPVEVDLVLVEPDVRLGLRQPRLANQFEEAALGLGAGEAWLVPDRVPQRADSAVAGVAGQLLIEGLI